MEKNLKITVVSFYSAVHFIVDLCCAVLVSRLTAEHSGNAAQLFNAIILYNLFAFAVQLPVGIIADKLNKNSAFSALGCLAVAFSYFLSDYLLAACIIAGLGNALFHVGGGIDVLNVSNGKAAPCGIFVSTGALGIFLGAQSEKIGFNQYRFAVIILTISAAALFWLFSKARGRISNEPFSLPDFNLKTVAAVFCLFLTVCLRSYVGLILSFNWKNTFIISLIVIIALVFGKMLGGIIGDATGYIRASAVSLSLAAILFLFSFKSPFAGVTAVLFFNMTMPLTLSALSKIFSGSKGLAFGLLTLALFIGFLPKAFGHTELFTPAGLFCVSSLSAVLMAAGLYFGNADGVKK